MRPWDASRPARLSALAAPLVRSTSTAFSRSPAVSSSAFLQSIMPAPVRARSSATSFAGMSFTVAMLLTPRKKRRPRAVGLGGRRSVVHRNGERPGSAFAFGSAARFRRGGGRRLLRLEPRGNGFRLGAALAPRRLLLLVAFRPGPAPRPRRLGHALPLFRRLVQRHLPPRFPDHLRDRRGDQRDRPDRVVVARNRHGDQ